MSEWIVIYFYYALQWVLFGNWSVWDLLIFIIHATVLFFFYFSMIVFGLGATIKICQNALTQCMLSYSTAIRASNDKSLREMCRMANIIHVRKVSFASVLRFLDGLIRTDAKRSKVGPAVTMIDSLWCTSVLLDPRAFVLQTRSFADKLFRRGLRRRLRICIWRIVFELVIVSRKKKSYKQVFVPDNF